MYKEHLFEIVVFDENNSYVRADKSDGGSTGWDQFRLVPDREDT